MSAHTPGPWNSGDRWPSGVVRGGPVQHWTNGSGQSQIAMCCGAEWMQEGELAANEKLIVAAPDLLADLAEAAATLRRYEALHRAKGATESTEKADVNAALASRFEATIAKARGES